MRLTLKEKVIEGVIQTFNDRQDLVNDLEEIREFFRENEKLDDHDLIEGVKPVPQIEELKAMISGIDLVIRNLFGDKFRMIDYHEKGELEGILRDIYFK